MSVTRTIVGLTAGILMIAGILFFSFRKIERDVFVNPDVKIVKTWKLPEILNEISGLSFIGNNKIACIQDEDGILFIYNLDTSEIEKQIEFNGNADYEGVEIVNSTAYILTSDGNLLEIVNFPTKPTINKISTGLPKGEDFEGLTYDKKNNRLLFAHKEENSESETIKAIYSYNLTTGKTDPEPIYSINMEMPIFSKIKGKRIHNRFRPSGMAMNQATGQIFLVEGTNPKLLVLDKDKNPKKLYLLNKNNFPQPEGIAFNSAGNLYISTEGNPGMIHHVSVK